MRTAPGSRGLGIDPTIDIVFKKIFGSAGREHLTLHFLNEILPLAGRDRAASLSILRIPIYSSVRLRERELQGIRVQTCIELTCNMRGRFISMQV